MIVPLQQTENGKGLELPHYATADSAGMDLRAAIHDPVVLRPGMRTLIRCGFIMALPRGFEGQIRPRSGLALKQGVTVLNSPGTVDADYRGEIKTLLINLGQDDFVIERGMRIAQFVIAPVTQIQWNLEAEGVSTEVHRGGGFGSTGLH
jgi:dUTP pyrophosphatase